ncbi:hypothetical protein Q5752_003340 [Cryptotrichosporon argae]
MDSHPHSHLASIIDYSTGGTTAQEEEIARYIASEAFSNGVAAPDDVGVGVTVGATVADASPVRAGSPLDPTVAVPPALLALAADVLGDSSYLPAAAPPSLESLQGLAWDTERGEMGGKRKKAPHLRAGWKEMEEADERKRRRVEEGPSQPQSQTQAQAQGHGVGETRAAGAAEQDQLLDPAVNLGADLGLAEQEDGTAEGDDASGRSKRMTKEQRAQQNRRAQQVYRRKREERIKQLELESALLAQTREALKALDAKYFDLVTDYESKKIEAAALQSAIVAAAVGGAASVVSPTSALVLKIEEYNAATPAATMTQCGHAFDRLAKESRQVAKMNRAKREERMAGHDAA